MRRQTDSTCSSKSLDSINVHYHRHSTSPSCPHCPSVNVSWPRHQLYLTKSRLKSRQTHSSVVQHLIANDSTCHVLYMHCLLQPPIYIDCTERVLAFLSLFHCVHVYACLRHLAPPSCASVAAYNDQHAPHRALFGFFSLSIGRS